MLTLRIPSEHFEDALRKKYTTAFGILLEDVENHLVLAHGAEVLDAHVARDAIQIGHGHRLQFGDVHGFTDRF